MMSLIAPKSGAVGSEFGLLPFGFPKSSGARAPSTDGAGGATPAEVMVKFCAANISTGVEIPGWLRYAPPKGALGMRPRLLCCAD